jgi:flagellar assembly factor FliW
MSNAVAEGITDEQILNFEDGIPGFPQCHRFVLVDETEGSAFQFLQCLDDTEVAMVVTVPWLFFPDYEPELSELEQQELEIGAPEDAVLFCPVTLDAANNRVYVNLMAPFVVNSNSRRGRQIVLTDSGYETRAVIEFGEN